MGITASLHLTGNDFTNAASAFYIATAVAVIVNLYLLQKVPTGKYLAFSLFCWGVTTTCHAALRKYAGLVALRVLSGLFEAAVPPSLMLLSSQYFTRAEQPLRFAYWYCGLGFGQIVGGLISFGFQHVQHAPLESWRYMFLSVGLFTVLFSAGVWCAVPDSPMKAWFLGDPEKVALLQHVKINQTGIENSRWHSKQVLDGLLDFQMWCMAIILLLQGTGGGVVTTCSSTLLVSFGFTPKQSSLLLIPAGAVNVIASLFGGLGPRYFGNRWLFLLILSAGGIAGACMMASLPHSSRGGLLASIYMVNILPGAGPIDYQWIMGNIAGHTK